MNDPATCSTEKNIWIDEKGNFVYDEDLSEIETTIEVLFFHLEEIRKILPKTGKARIKVKDQLNIALENTMNAVKNKIFFDQ